MNRTLLPGIATALLFAVSSASTFDPVAIKRTPTKGEKLEYVETGNVQVQGQTGDVSSKMSRVITDVAADGSYTTEVTSSDLTFNGMPIPMPTQTVKSVYSPTGVLQSVTAEDSTGTGRSSSLVQTYLPEKPVSVGDTWTYAAKKDDKLGIVPFTATMKYVGDEKVGGIDTWKIQEEVKESDGDTPASVSMTAWLDQKDGSLLKSASHFVNLPSGAFTVTGDMNIEKASLATKS